MNTTETQYWQERHEALLQMVTQQKQQLEQWEAGGILWTWTDVESYALDDLNVRLSRAECEAILKDVVDSHDPNRGVTWMVIDKAIRTAKGLLPIALLDYIQAPATISLMAVDRTSQTTYTSKSDILRYLRTHGFFNDSNPVLQKQQLQGLTSGYTWASGYGTHSISF
jgi:hypothetical protein